MPYRQPPCFAMELAFAFIVVVLTCGSVARSALALQVYDLETLVAQSTLVAEVELGGARAATVRDGEVLIRDARVVMVHRGDGSQVGRTVTLSGVEEYHLAPGIAGRATGCR